MSLPYMTRRIVPVVGAGVAWLNISRAHRGQQCGPQSYFVSLSFVRNKHCGRYESNEAYIIQPVPTHRGREGQTCGEGDWARSDERTS
jgi:hypothetical protein